MYQKLERYQWDINTLEIRLANRYAEDESKEDKITVFADIIIDSVSLYQRLKEYDFVLPLVGGMKSINSL